MSGIADGIDNNGCRQICIGINEYLHWVTLGNGELEDFHNHYNCENYRVVDECNLFPLDVITYPESLRSYEELEDLDKRVSEFEQLCESEQLKISASVFDGNDFESSLMNEGERYQVINSGITNRSGYDNDIWFAMVMIHDYDCLEIPEDVKNLGIIDYDKVYDILQNEGWNDDGEGVYFKVD